jgi:acylphosphatase
MDSDIIRKKIRFTGRVQGVGFRYRTQMMAAEIGLTGWVRNEYDGSVIMEVQGIESKIDRLIDTLNGSRFIRITDMDIKRIDIVEDERDFSIKGY